MATTRRPPKRALPETLRQAQTWDGNRRRYVEAGFCRRCAAQAAWGHQIGFAHIQPVGDCCRGVAVPGGRGERVARWAAGPVMTDAAKLARFGSGDAA